MALGRKETLRWCANLSRTQISFMNYTIQSFGSGCIHNKKCKLLYDRIVAKEKNKKLALIAVCNKLLKQAFVAAKPEKLASLA